MLLNHRYRCRSVAPAFQHGVHRYPAFCGCVRTRSSIVNYGTLWADHQLREYPVVAVQWTI